MEKITFECEVVTPMFMGGAAPNEAELRPASIKGALRFWWRAMKAEEDLEKLRREEFSVFGGIGGETNEGNSSKVIIMTDGKLNKSKENFPRHLIEVRSKDKIFQINILDYLAYGTNEYIKGRGLHYIKEYFTNNQSFKITFKFFKSDIITGTIEAFYLLYRFGGLGARSRNGFGGFKIKNSDIFIREGIDTNFLSQTDIPQRYDNLPPYTAFSKESKLFVLKDDFTSWDSALAKVGKIYRETRLNLEPRHKFDKRQYISSPIIEGETKKSILDRHSKPYFLKVQKVNEKSYQGFILFLPYKYGVGLNNNKLSLEEYKKVTAEFNKLLRENKDLKEVNLFDKNDTFAI